MSILIKGMDMPKSCYECQLLEGDTMDGLCHAANKWLDDDYFRWFTYDEGDIDDSKPLNCPLVEVPSHGDLINRNATSLTDFEIVMCGGDYKEGMNLLLQKIKDAPTIIQADHFADDSKAETN